MDTTEIVENTQTPKYTAGIVIGAIVLLMIIEIAFRGGVE